MEKLYTNRLKREIVEQASQFDNIDGFDINPKDLTKSPLFREEEAIVEDQRQYSSRKNINYVNAYDRASAIRLMLNENRWSENLAIAYSITKKELITYFHTIKILFVKLNQEVEEEWRQEVVERGLQYWGEEQQKLIEYKSRKKSLLRGLLSDNTLEKNKIPPRLFLINELNWLKAEIHKLGVNIDILDRQLNNHLPINANIGRQLIELQKKKRQYIETKILRVRQMRKDTKSEKRFVLIDSISKEIIKSGNTTNSFLNVRSVKHGISLLDDYVHWYNSKNAVEIDQVKAENKRLTDKVYYDAKPEIFIKREEKTKKLERAIQLKREGKSQQQIVNQMNSEGFKVSKSTIQRWLTILN